MKLKFLIFLFALLLVFQASADVSLALECTIGCKSTGPMMDQYCAYQESRDNAGIPPAPVYSSCIINPSTEPGQVWSYGPYCYDNPNRKYCQSNDCPTSIEAPFLITQDGAPCKVLVPCLSSGGSSCSSKSMDGKWDANQNKCMTCYNKKESLICGDGNAVYLWDGISTLNPNDACPGNIFCSKNGDQKFDSACGAEIACDEKVKGEDCGPEKACNDLGQCVRKGCKPCPDADGTLCGACSSNGNFCKNVNNVGTLVSGEEAVANCPNECVKYVVQTNMRYAKGYTGPHTDTAEICFDTPTGKDANGKTIYANWMVDTYINSNRIMETQCGSDTGHNNMNKCFKYEYGCGQNAVVQDDPVTKNLLPQIDSSYPQITATKSFYCAGKGGSSSTGGSEPPPGPGPCAKCGSPAHEF